MPGLWDLLQQLQNKAEPRSDLITPGSTGALENAKPYTFMGRVSTNPNETILSLLSKLPSDSPDAEGLAGMGRIAPLLGAGMAKQFKPASGTLEDLIGRYAKAEQGIGGRGKLIPALNDAGEIFAGKVGGQHPWDAYQSTMMLRKVPASLPQHGYQVPGEKAFIPTDLATILAFPEGVKKVDSLIKKGIPMTSILEAIKHNEALQAGAR